MMKVGEIGILQNIETFKYLEGTIAEILAVGPEYHGRFCECLSAEYTVKTSLPVRGQNLLGIRRHQIKKLSDPDAEIEKELELVE